MVRREREISAAGISHLRLERAGRAGIPISYYGRMFRRTAYKGCFQTHLFPGVGCVETWAASQQPRGRVKKKVEAKFAATDG